MVQQCVVYEKIRKRRRNLFFARLGVLNWRHTRSQPPAFGLAVLYPIGSEFWCFWYIKTRERKIALKKTFLLHLSAHCGDLIKQIKKICHIHVKRKLSQVNWTCVQTGTHNVANGKIWNVIVAVYIGASPLPVWLLCIAYDWIVRYLFVRQPR